MHRAAAAFCATGFLAVDLRDHLLHPAALCDVVAMRAVRAEDVVLIHEVGADAGRDRLLADIEVDGTANVALKDGLDETFFHEPYPHHCAVEVQKQGSREFFLHKNKKAEPSHYRRGGAKKEAPPSRLSQFGMRLAGAVRGATTRGSGRTGGGTRRPGRCPERSGRRGSRGTRRRRTPRAPACGGAPGAASRAPQVPNRRPGSPATRCHHGRGTRRT